jgi:hypothetical protein
VVSLKSTWHAQKKQRHQELLERQQQVRESLTEFQQERQAKAVALRHDLNVFQQSLQQETQNLLIDISSDRQQRSAQVAQQLRAFAQALQQQTTESLEVIATDRSLMAQELAQDLSTFHAGLNQSVQILRKNLHIQMQTLQATTQEFLQDCQQQRARNQMQTMQSLAAYIMSLQEQVQTYLVELHLARQERGQQVGQMLQESRDHRLAETQELFQQLAVFRTELKEYCQSLHESVWGNSPAIPQAVISQSLVQKAADAKVTVVKLAAENSATKKSRVTKQPSAKKPEEVKLQPTAQTVSQAIPHQVEPAVGESATNFSKYTSLEVAANSKSATLQAETAFEQDAELLQQKIYSHIKQIEGARLTEIQSAVGINRSQTVDSLRALIKKGLITQRDRVYLVQEDSL